jgi:maltose O-acetyltransferase
LSPGSRDASRYQVTEQTHTELITAGPNMTTPGVRPATETELAQIELGQSSLSTLRELRVQLRVTLARLGIRLGLMSPTSPRFPHYFRVRLLRRQGMQIAFTVTGLQRCEFDSENVRIGDGTFVNAGCHFVGRGNIDIGCNVLIGPQVMILTSSHAIDACGQVSREANHKPVRIADRCWIGARSLIMPGVTIGEGTVIGAGAVVTKDCEPGAVYVGVPARRIR